MARLVVLSFEDNEMAERFVDSVPEWQGPFKDEAKVLGMFALPTQFCEGCSHKKRGWAKGKKYGWWVCAQCGKPSKYNPERLYRNVIGCAVNLLKGSEDRASTPFDDGWGSFRDQDIPAADRLRYGIRHQEA